MDRRRTKRLLCDKARVLLWLVNDSGVNEISLALLDCAPHGHFLPVFLDIREETFHAFVLHQVLDGTESDAFLVTFAYFHCFCKFDHRIPELIIDIFVDVDPFQGQADLGFVLSQLAD